MKRRDRGSATRSSRSDVEVALDELNERRARSGSADDRKAAASYRGLSSGTLRSLAADDDHEVRLYCAMNAGCPPDVLRHLADDLNGNVRFAAARNAGCPPDALALLVLDEYRHVRNAAARHPGCPPEARAFAGLAG